MTSPWITLVLFCLFCFPPGDTPPTQQPKCTDFQNANLLHGTNLRVQFLLFTPSDPSCGKLVEESRDLQNSGFNATLGTKLLIHGFRWEQTNQQDCLCWKVESDHRKLVGSKRRNKFICSHMSIPHLLLSVKVSHINTNTHYVVHSHWSHMLLLPSVLVYTLLNNK